MRSYRAKLWSGVFMVFGTTVGAGMLGIPAVTAPSGLFPAFAATLLVWVFMAITGLLLLEVTLQMPQGANLLSLSDRFLGKGGKWITGVLFLFLYYCLLVAYFSGGAPLLGQLCSWLGVSLSPLGEKFFFITLFGGIVCLGVSWIDKMNLILTFCMLFAYLILTLLGVKEVQVERFSYQNPSFVIQAVPILFSAFGFHNVVPPLATYLGRDRKALRLSILLGTLLACLLYVVWQGLVLGSVPLEALEMAKKQGLPVTYALQAVARHSSVYVFGQLFAFFALTTSFLGVGFSFVDFLQDGFAKGKYKVSRFLCSLLTLIPPFLCVLFIPSLFEKALGLAGGFGESVLNGILPVVLFLKMHTSLRKEGLRVSQKALFLLLLLLSLFVVVIEALSL